MNKKFIFLSRANVTADVAQTKMRHHMAAYENAMWHTRVHLRICARVCVINENKHPF